jgi:hypothetical protein
MALVLKDRVRETSISVGTSTISVLGAVTGYQTFLSAIGSGNTCYYTIYNQGTNEWEVGIGTVGVGTLSRDTVISSSTGGTLVNFSTGNKDVFVTYPAEKAVYLNASDNITPTALTVTSLTGPVTGTIGATTPNTGAFTSLTATLDSSFNSTGALKLPVGTTAQQPTGANGKIRFNSDIGKYEGYAGTSWSSLGGGATGGGSDEIFIENGQTVTTTYSIPSGKNAMSTGPITINAGATVTVPSGSRWVVL